MDRVKRLWRRVENVAKMRNCATKNSRTNSIKGGGGRECDNPPFGIRMVKTEDWSNTNLVVESRAIKIDREILKNEVVEELIVS